MAVRSVVMLISVFILFSAYFVPCLAKANSSRTFEIDYSKNTFKKDGVPFRYVAGSMHYSRVHPGYWQDRLRKMRAAGLNAVQGYVPWNVHELEPGKFTWFGASDLGHYLHLAQQEDLLVLLRLGPYICGEWEFGGFPAWLLTENPNMILRSSDPSFLKWVDRWYTELLTKIEPYLYKNGGPIIMVQIENEYGSYFTCDKDYTHFLRDKVEALLGKDVVIYTTDGAGDGFLKCGKVDGVYATVDFGAGGDPAASFKPQRDYEKFGPLVNSEFYTGWLDHWGSPHSHTDKITVSKSLDKILAYKNYTNVDMYMFVGGTNFGYMNGANEPAYQPVPTSYDYDAPVSEAGDVTLKYYAIRDIVAKYLPLPSTPIPPNTNKTNYGPLKMRFVITLPGALRFLTPEGPKSFKLPVPMETIKFYGGFILYRHVLKKDYTSPTILSCTGIKDRAMVMINEVPWGILDREAITQISITGTAESQLDILVENQGRVGFKVDMNFNNKGIVGNVSLGGEVLTDWLLYPIHTEYINDSLISYIEKHESSLSSLLKQPLKSPNGTWWTPAIYTGQISHPDPQGMQDTFLDPGLFRKGQAFINTFNLGRYWPLRGPQVRLYIPKPVFFPYPAKNNLYLLELEHSPCIESTLSHGCNVTLVDTPYLNGPNHPDSSMVYSSNNNDPNLHLVH